MCYHIQSMRLYKIELVGFKSFKDKVTIEVPEGIVGIVGPNGCGKSNVVDAVKWALGEQNPRHLRAKGMEDVIFAGTTEFASSGMAEVSLFFKREKEPFPEPYSNLSELVITRRLYRSGESEYLINKSQCRLKDITDITIDTGLGQRFYGLIEQGMVESFMNYKPEEKRLIFEEVAGTAKYRLRKKATIQKLESAKLNLNRVEDILSEVESRCKELEKEAARAREYKKIFDNLKKVELYTNAVTYSELMTVFEEKKNEINILEASLQEKEIQSTSLESELEVKKNELFFLEKSVEEHKKEIFRLGEAILKAEKELNAVKEGKGYRQRKIEELNQQKNDLIDKKGKLKAELETIEKELKTFEAGLSEKDSVLREQEKLDNQTSLKIREVNNSISMLQAEIAKDKNQLAYSESQIAYEERVIEDTNNRLTVLKKELEELVIDADNSKSTLEELKSALRQKEKEKEAILAALDTLNQSFINEKKNAAEMRRRLQEKELKRERLLGTYNSSKKFVEDYKGLSSGAQHVLKNFSKNEILGTFIEHIEVREELLTALENFLKDKMELILVNDTEVACKAIDYLKKGSLGSCFLLPLSHLDKSNTDIDSVLLQYVKFNEQVKDILYRLFANLKIAKNLGEAINRFLSGERCNFLTLEGDVLDEYGVVYGGSKGKHNPFIIEKARLKELEAELGVISSELEIDRNAIKEKENLIKSIEEEINSKKKELSELDFELSEEKTNVRLKEEDLKRKLLKLENVKQEIKNLELNLTSYNKKKNDLAESVKRLTSVISEKEAKLKEKNEELEKLRIEQEAKRDEITKLKVALAEEKRNLFHKKENRDRLRGQLNAIESQITTVAKEEDALLKIDSEADKKLKDCENELIKLKSEEDAINSKTRVEEETLNTLRTKQREEEKKLSQLRSELEKLRKNVFNLKEMLSETELNIRLIEERIREKYFVEISKHYEEYKNLPVTKEECSHEFIEEKWKQLREMGEVNLLSIEEYEEVKTRYDFLTKQKKDIEESIESLNGAIDRMNKVSVELFLNSIKGIEENFDKLFKRLFGGGKAKILLTDEDNPLESGVDIAVEPPFKKFQNIELLSGGEKALVALSLMFAFYMLKPSPFCILDEVDAPLDDANVIKYKELLKEMSRFSQFMVVTHNKIVMETANILYGVTMETPGVSKVISVKTERGEMWQ